VVTQEIDWSKSKFKVFLVKIGCLNHDKRELEYIRAMVARTSLSLMQKQK